MRVAAGPRVGAAIRRTVPHADAPSSLRPSSTASPQGAPNAGTAQRVVQAAPPGRGPRRCRAVADAPEGIAVSPCAVSSRTVRFGMADANRPEDRSPSRTTAAMASRGVVW